MTFKIRTSLLITLGVSALTLHLAMAQQAPLALHFHNEYQGKPLSFKDEYTNVHGEKLSFTLLNYFISNIQLVQADGSVYSVPQDTSYFLVRHHLPASHSFRLTVPEGEYTSVRFTIGVDSARSTMGADKRQGVLDVGAQARGMYWQWNSGYIFFKTEGKSTASPDSLQNSFFYHIGGYGGFDSKTLNNIRTKELRFEKKLSVSKKKAATVHIATEMTHFFKAVKIGENPSIMWGPVSTTIADNYPGVFSLKTIAYPKR